MGRATRSAPDKAGSAAPRAARASAARASAAARAHGRRAPRTAATATDTAGPSIAETAAAASAGPGTTRELIWRLQSGGWTQLEAGNLAAIALGVRPARTGWTGAELDHLRFLKSLVSAGRLER